MRFLIRLLYIIAGIIIILSAIFYFFPPSEYFGVKEPSFETFDVSATQQEGLIYALVVDMDDDHSVTKSSVLSGKDPILVLREQGKEENDQQAERFFFNDMSSLMQYDDNGDQWITVADDIFPRLELMTILSPGNHNYVSLTRSGIEAIVKASDGRIAYVVMRDGSRRDVRLLQLRVQDLQ